MDDLRKKEANSVLPRGRVFRRYIITYTAILIVPCLILGLFFFTRATNQIEQNAQEARQYNLDQLALALSKEFSSMLSAVPQINNASGIASHDNLVFMPYRWQDSKYTRTEVIWKLSQLIKTSPLISDCILLYRRYDIVFTSSTSNDAEVYFQSRLIFDSPDRIIDYMNHTDICRLVPVTINNTLSHTKYDALLYIVPFNLEKTKTKDMAISFIIPADRLDSWSQLTLGSHKYRVDLFDDNQAPLLSYGTYDGDSLLASAFDPQGALNQEQVKAGGQTISLFQAYAPTPEMTLVLEALWDDTLQQLDEFRNLTLFLSGLTFLIGLMLVMLFSYFNYAPLKQILRSLHEQFPLLSHAGRENEYQQLDDAIKTTISNNKKLEDHINAQSKAIYHQILLELLSGNIQYDRLDKTFDIKVHLPGPRYIVAVTREKNDKALAAIAGLLDKPIDGGQECKYAIVSMLQYQCTAIILSLNDVRQPEIQADSRIMRIAETYTLRLGVSSLCGDIGLLNSCMIEACLALDYAELKNTTRIQPFNSDLSREFSLDLPSASILDDFGQSLRNGNEPQSIALFQDMMNAIDHHINPVRIRIQYYPIVNIILRVIHEMDIDSSAIKLDVLSLFQNIDSFRANIIQILQSICTYGQKKQNNPQSDLYSRLIRHIDDHYLDYDFSLEQLSSQFGMSASALSTSFKKHMGIGFNEYLTQKKLDVARHMLRTSSVSVREIASVVGYHNESYFIKIFKTSDGVTPAQYRKKYCVIYNSVN